MKKNDVPQDDANMLDGKLREPCYSVDENGKYVTVQSVGWEPKNIVMQQVWDDIYEKAEREYQSFLRGKASPIKYYLEINIMNISLLSQYTGIKKRIIRKHLRYKHFSRLDNNTLGIYANTFGISIDELKDPGKHIENRRSEHSK